MNGGKFIISIDLELHWGNVEKWDINKKSEYFLKSKKTIPKVLKLFEQNNIKATWAAVGFLFAKDKLQLLKSSPKLKPTYLNKIFFYYDYFPFVGKDEEDDPYHYAGDIIRQIIKTKGQELATHTFSHYYCNEAGQTAQQFDKDLKAAQQIAKENYNVNLQSLVFPRNQFNHDYLDVAIENGIKVVRSNPDVWFWKYNYSKLNSFFRAVDTLMPFSHSLCFEKVNKYKNLIILPASRFFRPYKKSEYPIQYLKMNRIKLEMSYAAKSNKNYHLWWHPHNFGEDIVENMNQLHEIINHYKYLKEQYNFISNNMIDFDE